MKKLFLTAAVMLTSMATYAQHAVGSLTLQPRVGINFANITKGDGDTRVGLAAGAELEYQATDLLGISFGAMYSMQGAKTSIDSNLGSVDATMKLDYINIPILANVYVVKGLAVKLGIQPGFNVSNKVSAKVSSSKLEEDIDGIKSFDFSIPVGLSYEYNNVVLDARYNFGCTKIVDDSDSKNSVFQITLGYKFNL